MGDVQISTQTRLASGHHREGVAPRGLGEKRCSDSCVDGVGFPYSQVTGAGSCI